MLPNCNARFGTRKLPATSIKIGLAIQLIIADCLVISSYDNESPVSRPTYYSSSGDRINFFSVMSGVFHSIFKCHRTVPYLTQAAIAQALKSGAWRNCQTVTCCLRPATSPNPRSKRKPESRPKQRGHKSIAPPDIHVPLPFATSDSAARDMNPWPCMCVHRFTSNAYLVPPSGVPRVLKLCERLR
jgi:hypothetical protein